MVHPDQINHIRSKHMKRLIGRAVLCVTITTLIFSAVSAFAVTDKPSPVPPPEMKMKKAEVLDSSSLSGKVVETMNAGGYTYVSLEKDGKKTWVAIPETVIKVGQKVSFQPGGEMRNFVSKTLNRTFESIIFSGGLASQPGPAAGNKPSSSQHSVKSAESPKSTEKISVGKASGPDAYTVSEIYANCAKLNEKTAVVKGKVVKVSQGIMGKNWIHLQDGTGDAGKETNKLVTTSQDLPAVGDIVTMKGTIYKDKDFGAGYKYAVIMEQASIQR
jgi:hypothetical protein